MVDEKRGPVLGWEESASRPTGLGIEEPARTGAGGPGKVPVKVEDLERFYLELSAGTFGRTLAVLGLQEGWTPEDLSRQLRGFVEAIQQSKDNKVKVYTSKVAKKAFAEWFDRLTKISAECGKNVAAHSPPRGRSSGARGLARRRAHVCPWRQPRQVRGGYRFYNLGFRCARYMSLYRCTFSHLYLLTVLPDGTRWRAQLFFEEFGSMSVPRRTAAFLELAGQVRPQDCIPLHPPPCTRFARTNSHPPRSCLITSVSDSSATCTPPPASPATR